MKNQNRFPLSRDRNDTGASLVEYAMLVALIAIVSLSAANYLGSIIEGDVKTVNRTGFAASGGVCDPTTTVCP